MNDPKTETTIVRPDIGNTTVIGRLMELTTDYERRSVDRLGYLALALAIAGVLAYVINVFLSGVLPPRTGIYLGIGYFLVPIGVFISLLMWWLTRQGFSSKVILDKVGVAYVLLIGSIISLYYGQSLWWLEQDRFQGVPFLTVWIILVAVVIPSTVVRATIIAGLLALTGPLSVLLMTMHSAVGAAPFSAYFDATFPNILSAVIGIYISHSMYQLGQEVKEARLLGSYQLEHKLGSGGMGDVWQASHAMLARPAAIKLIQTKRLEVNAEDAKTRFFREANATSSLSSPHTVQLYDFGMTDDGTLYFAMEVLDGDDLTWIVRRHGALPANRVIYLLTQICDSLTEAHDAGLLHRDIQPSNVFVCHVGTQYDFVKVLDFGLARSVRDLASFEPGSRAEGTPHFMAPEVFDPSQELDGRMDIYSLGCVAYWMLTAGFVFPVHGDHLTNVRQTITPIPPSACLKQKLPAGLDDTIMACLAKHPDDRPATVMELQERLLQCEVDEPWTNDHARKWWQRRS